MASTYSVPGTNPSATPNPTSLSETTLSSAGPSHPIIAHRGPYAKISRRAARARNAIPGKNGRVNRADQDNAFLKAFKLPNVRFVGLNALYGDPEADVVLRSEDGVEFRVRIAELRGTSDVFNDMLEAFNEASSSALDALHPSATNENTHQPPIDIEAPAIILRHFCDLLTNTTLLPLDADARESLIGPDDGYGDQRSRVADSLWGTAAAMLRETGSTAVSPYDLRYKAELTYSHKRRLHRQHMQKMKRVYLFSAPAYASTQDADSAPSTPQSSDAASRLADPTIPVDSPHWRGAAQTSQHFTDLFRSPSLRGPCFGIRRLSLLLDLLDRFACKPALYTRALGHYTQSIPHDPWGAFVLFSKRRDVDRCKLAIEHFWRLAPSEKDKAAAVRDIKMDDLGEENRARLKGAKVSKSGVILGAENLDEVRKAHLNAGEAKGLCMGVDVQNLSVEMAGQVPLAWLMGYMRAFDNWRARQAAQSAESVGESETIGWVSIAAHFSPVK